MPRWVVYHPPTGLPLGVVPALDEATALQIARDRHGADVAVRLAPTTCPTCED